MDITKIDKNFTQTKVIQNGKKKYILPCSPFKLYGGLFEKGIGFVRMPQKIAATVSEGVFALSKNGAGIRLNFSTDSKSLRLIVELGDFCRVRHMPLTNSSGFSLCYRDKVSGKMIFKSLLSPEWNFGNSFEVATQLDGQFHDYILNFPSYSYVKSLAIEIDDNAFVGEGRGYKNLKPILYYGSSITQGACASRADTSYEHAICEKTNVDFINLGFSGNAKAEDNMVDYLRSIDCSIFVCDYDYNAPSIEHLQNTHKRVYDRYREIRKDVPIVFISRPEAFCSVATDSRAEIIRSTYEGAISCGDKNVYFIDGRTFFPEEVKYRCLVDGIHPNDLGFYFISEKIGVVINQILNARKV